jgi:gamma-glutamyltranspeptidase/glutathione hydrolase
MHWPHEQAKPTGEAMVAAADPYAVEAGLEMLRAGGTAIDAAIAVEVTLGLVEPDSSGIGGGGFLVHYTGAARRSTPMTAANGRRRARRRTCSWSDGKPMSFELAQASGALDRHAGADPMLKLAHEQHGKLPWAKLFEPAIKLAEEGFHRSGRA